MSGKVVGKAETGMVATTEATESSAASAALTPVMSQEQKLALVQSWEQGVQEVGQRLRQIGAALAPTITVEDVEFVWKVTEGIEGDSRYTRYTALVDFADRIAAGTAFLPIENGADGPMSWGAYIEKLAAAHKVKSPGGIERAVKYIRASEDSRLVWQRYGHDSYAKEIHDAINGLGAYTGLGKLVNNDLQRIIDACMSGVEVAPKCETIRAAIKAARDEAKRNALPRAREHLAALKDELREHPEDAETIAEDIVRAKAEIAEAEKVLHMATAATTETTPVKPVKAQPTADDADDDADDDGDADDETFTSAVWSSTDVNWSMQLQDWHLSSLNGKKSWFLHENVGSAVCAALDVVSLPEYVDAKVFDAAVFQVSANWDKTKDGKELTALLKVVNAADE